jgi:hypothetical protein
MTKKVIDYSMTIIYKIVCKDLSIKEIYVGHTTDFKSRKYQHKNKCKTSTYKIYQTIKENGDWKNWEMIEVEKYPCADGNEARARERYWYEILEASLNTRNPICNVEDYRKNKKEWEENNKERVKEYRKKNYEKNQEKRREYNKQYYQRKKKLSSTNI